MKLSNSLFLAAFLVGAIGCSSSSDAGTDGGTTDGGTDSVVVPTDTGSGTETAVDTGSNVDSPSDGPSAACQTCINSKCSSEGTACQADTQCAADIECISKCTTAACQNDCITNECGADGGTTCHSGDLFNAFVGCVQTNCATACGT